MSRWNVAQCIAAGLLTLSAPGCSADGAGDTPTPALSAEDEAFALDLWDEFGDASAFLQWSTAPAGLTNPDDIYQSRDHSSRWVLSYANDVAAAALADWQGAVPEGGMLVKAQYADEAGADLRGFTVMAKRTGYDADHADWFWASFTSAGDLNDAGKLPQCYGCHAASERDYIRTSF